MARRSGSNGERTAQAVQDAAIRLIAQKGFAAVSMRQIAADVGVQAGALYLYTPDKQSLLFDIMRSHMEHLLSSWAATALHTDDPVKELEAFVRFHISYHIARPEKVFISYMELRNLEPENFTAIEHLRRNYETILEQILRKGAQQGRFVISDPKVTTFAMIAMLTGVSTWYRDTGRLAPEEIEQNYVDLAFRMIGSSDEKPALRAAE